MITNMRHKLVLSLYSTIGLAGLAACAIGLFSACGVVFIMLAASAADTSGFRFDFALMLAGGWLLLGAVGGLVAWFGLRTWYVKRRQGPSPDEDSVAKTPIGKVVAVIIFGAFALYAV